MKRFFEWYFGIPPAEPGQGTQWNWVSETPWPSATPQWLLLLSAIGILLYLLTIYRRDAQRASRWMRGLLLALRLLVLACVLLVLSELTLVVDRTGLPFVAVLIDDSASMSLDDQYADAKEQAAVRTLLGESPGQPASRLRLAQNLLTRQDAGFLRRLQLQHQLRLYRFSQTATVLGGLEAESGSTNLSPILTAIRNLEAGGTETRPAQAVKKVLNDFRGSLPSAIILLTDGISSTGPNDRLTVAAEAAAQRLVPLYLIGIGSEEAAHDLGLYDMLLDEVAFVGDPVTVSARLKSSGFKDKPLTLILRDRQSRATLATRPIKAGEDGTSQPLEVIWTPEKPGDFELELEVSPQPSEIDQSNNQETRPISVREGRMRVLLVDSTPRWEFRELKFLLEREKTIELHTVLQDADLEFAEQDTTAQPLRGRFPATREQLLGYDVIILGDVDAAQISPVSIGHLRDFVREAGAGLIMIAGPRFNPLTYRGTPLETLLPVALDGLTAPAADEPITDEFHPTLTLEGQKSVPIFRFHEDEQQSLQIWRQLPGLYWMISAPEVKPGATVFAEHPERMGHGRRLPLIAMQRFGAGKVLFHATDELWLWRRRAGDLYYGRYWIQAIRYLSRSRLIGSTRDAELRSDRQVYSQGESVTLRLRFFNEEQLPSSDEPVKVMLERRGAGTQEVELKKLPQLASVYEGQMRRPPNGGWHAWVKSPELGDVPPSTDFRVEAPEQELRLRGLDRTGLTDAARITRGRTYSLSEASRLPDEIPRGRPVPLRSEEPIRFWNRWELLLLFVTLLTAEWLLRKRLQLR